MQNLLDIFDIKNLIPHGYCLSWSPLLLNLHTISDIVITLAYYSIPLSLLHFIRHRKDLPYPWLVVMFALFIVACGTTHLLSAITIWIPLYWLEAYTKVFTALISLASALAMFFVIPLLLKLPSQKQLQAEIERCRLIDKARQEALERLEKIASRIPGVVYTYRLNPDGSSCFPYSSPAITDIYQVTPQEVQKNAEKVFEILHPDDYQQIVTSILESAQHLTPWQLEYRVCINNEERWLFGNAIPEREADGATLWHGFITDITKRKLKEIEYETIIQASNNGFLCIDTLGNILVVNNALCSLLGYNQTELLSMTIMNIEAMENPEETARHIQEVITKGYDNFETKYRCKNGEILDIAINVLYVKELGSRFFAFAENISHRKQAERKLKRSEEIFRNTFENAAIGVVNLSLDGRFLAVNQTYCDFLGYSREELLSMSILDITLPEEKNFNLQLVQQLLSGKSGSFCIEKHYVRKDKQLVWGSLSVKLNYAPNGLPEYFISTVENIDARKKIEAEIIATRNQLQATLKAIPDLLFEVDAQGRYWDYHSPHTELLVAPPEVFLGKTIYDILPVEVAKICMSALKEAEQFGHSSGKQFQLDLVQGTHWFEISVARKEIINEQLPHFVVLSRDITERKRAEEKSQESNKKFRDLIEKLPLGLALINKVTNELFYINERVTLLLGYTLKDIANLEQWRQMVYPDEQYRKQIRALWQAAIKEALEQGTDIKPIECTLTCKNGMQREVLVSGIFFEDSILVTFTDITERKRMEEIVKANESFIVSILNSLPAHIAVLDSQGVIALVNNAWKKFADYNNLSIENNYMLAANYLEICTHAIEQTQDAVVREVLQGIQAVMQGKINQFNTEYPCHSPEEQRWFNMSVSPLQGLKQGVVISHENITQRKLMQEALRANETRFRTIIETLPIPIGLSDSEMNVSFLNPAFIEIFGYDKQDIPTLAHWWPKAYPDNQYRQWVLKYWDDAYTDNTLAAQERIICCKDGSKRTVLVEHVNFPNSIKDNRLTLFYDITERKQAETQLRIAATVFEAQEGMMVADANHIILNVNQAFTQITGYSAAEVIGKTPHLLYSAKHNKTFYNNLWKNVYQMGSWQGEIWSRRKNGDTYPQWLTITAVKNNNSHITHYVATMIDITERKATEDYINQLAFYDALTQLPNRRLLQERLKHSIEVCQRTGDSMALLMLDLDRFKAVNDTLGHAAGDELLQQVAGRIKKCLRKTDLLARLGGDEFIILIDKIKHYKNSARVADIIIKKLSQAFILSDNHEVYIGASIGISIYPQHGITAEALRDNADTALYHAKDSGRGCFAYFSDELTLKVRKRLALEARLRKAIEQNELSVYFQPQISLKTGQIIGAEALVRWHDPVHGCLMPNTFINIAEETGLIVVIGEWVLRETCRLGAKWLADGFMPIILAVNVSPYQFSRCDINHVVAQVLQETTFPACYLELEITESGIMNNQKHAMNILSQLHQQGVKLAIDDFGTGYSSLAYLKYFPVDLLKIDKSFLEDIPFSEDDMNIAATIIALGHHLGFKVLAEGIETLEQLEFLDSQGCDYYQGYFYSKAISADDFAVLLATKPLEK
ncbi:MAG: PAS domain S-box protein [Methylococcaceae bacterium]